MTDTPTGYPPDLDAAVRERQAAPHVPYDSDEQFIRDVANDGRARVVVPGGGHLYHLKVDEVIAAIRAAGCVPVDGQGREIDA